MIFKVPNRKNLIALSLACVMVISGFEAYKVYAADPVDVDADVKLTATISNEDTSMFNTYYTGDVVIDIYKIASLDENAKPTLTAAFKNSGADVSILQGVNSVEDIQTKIVDKVMAVVENNPDIKVETITAKKTAAGLSDATANLSGAGVYLYVPRKAYDDRYEYEFTSYIIVSPTNILLPSPINTPGQNPKPVEAWEYNVSFSLKSIFRPRYGSVEISKTLNTFNESLGTTACVFKVNAILDNKLVFSNVYTINFDKAETKTFTVDKLPAGSEVTVEEVYSGASYQTDSSAQTVNIKAGKVEKVSFTNDYNKGLLVSGESVVNAFSYDEDGSLSWSKNNGSKGGSN